MAIDPRTVYTDPQAQAAILMGEQTPEKTQIASNILNKGLSGAIDQMNQPAGTQTAQAAPPSTPGNGEVNVEDLLRRGLGPEESARQRAFAEQQSISNWLLINEKEPVPWAPGLTWGEYIDSVLAMKGPEAAEEVIKNQIKQEKDSQPKGDVGVRNLPPIPVPQASQVAAGRPIAPPQGRPMPAPQGRPMPAPQGIMAAAEGGLIPATAPVGEKEFMQTLRNLAQGAGVNREAIETVAENIEVPGNDDVMDSGIMQTVEAVEATDSDLTGIGSLVEISDKLAERGEGLVHATPGELIFDPRRLNEPDQRMLLAALETAGIPWEEATVGNEANILNQMTGLPAFGWFSKIWKKTKKAVKQVGKWMKRNAGTILGIAGAMTGNPFLAALGAGIGSLIEGKPIQAALISAGMSFVGTKWVGPWIGEAISGVVPSLGTTAIGEAAGEAIPGQFGRSLSEIGGQAAAREAATQTAGEAAARVMMSSSVANLTPKLAQEAGAKAAYMSMLQPLTQGSMSSLATSLGKEASKELALGLASEAGSQITGSILSQGISSATQFVVPQAGIGSLIGTAPSFAVGTGVERLLGTSVAEALGGVAAGAAQMYAQPMIEQMTTGVPGDQEADVIAAWSERYDFTPTSDQLYTFYTNEYLPNQQIDVAQTIGQIPGYGNISLAPSTTAGVVGDIFQAAGGGYIRGKGTPKSDSNLALVSNGEFVMTEAATRGADPLGLGDRMRGARRMYDSMKELEARVA